MSVEFIFSVFGVLLLLGAVVLGVTMWQLGNLRGRVKTLSQPTSHLFDTLPAQSGHTHTLRINSRHQEQGREVLVKVCDCGHIVREML